jgi:hypothetical protein
MFGGYALEIVIAADGAVSGKTISKWRKPTAKTQSAAGAAPRQAADQSGGEIPKGASARSAASRGLAGWANHQRRSFG